MLHAFVLIYAEFKKWKLTKSSLSGFNRGQFLKKQSVKNSSYTEYILAKKVFLMSSCVGIKN